MAISVFDLFRIGIGPSSSHSVGPMRAARQFVIALRDEGILPRVAEITIDLLGSLGATGKGHGTDIAVLLGLCGELPELVEPRLSSELMANVLREQRLPLLGVHWVRFVAAEHLRFQGSRTLPFHPNAMQFAARDSLGACLSKSTYYSVGGGFVVQEGESPEAGATPPQYEFSNCDELLQLCCRHSLSISQVMLENEMTWRSESDIRRGLLDLWSVMQGCVAAGLTHDGTLPGGLKVRRRAPDLYRRLLASRGNPEADAMPGEPLDWVTLYAFAASEENAAGGRVVTAPTNGAAGIVPAVLHYYRNFCLEPSDEGIVRFLLAAGAIGIICKRNASISGAEVGCQGEVGSACSMAAAGLTEVLGGTPEQVENAAEIAMEHNLGLTCDPVAGLVQIPCIERNAIAAVKAITAARMALRGDGAHHVSFDQVVKTMWETGRDMEEKYRETSRGGLALNVVEC